MTRENLNKKNKKAMLAFMLVLFSFLVLINILVISQFRATIINSQAVEEKHETELFTNFVTSLVIQKIIQKLKVWLKTGGMLDTI